MTMKDIWHIMFFVFQLYIEEVVIVLTFPFCCPFLENYVVRFGFVNSFYGLIITHGMGLMFWFLVLDAFIMDASIIDRCHMTVSNT